MFQGTDKRVVESGERNIQRLCNCVDKVRVRERKRPLPLSMVLFVGLSRRWCLKLGWPRGCMLLVMVKRASVQEMMSVVGV